MYATVWRGSTWQAAHCRWKKYRCYWAIARLLTSASRSSAGTVAHPGTIVKNVVETTEGIQAGRIAGYGLTIRIAHINRQRRSKTIAVAFFSGFSGPTLVFSTALTSRNQV